MHTRMHTRTTTAKSRIAMKKTEDRQGYVLIGVCAGVIAVGVAAFALTRAPDRDDYGCQIGTTPPVLHVAVVDRTEKLDPAANDLLVSALKHWQGKAKPEERLTLYAFDGKASEPFKVLFDQCRVPKGSEVNPIWTSKDKVEARFVDTFIGGFDKAVSEATSMKGASETALAAYLGRLGAHLAYAEKGKSTTLSIFSDMGDNGRHGSLIGKKPVESTVFRDHVVRSLGTRFAGTPVHVATIPTPSTPPAVQKRIKENWLKAFEAAGVTVTWETL